MYDNEFFGQVKKKAHIRLYLMLALIAVFTAVELVFCVLRLQILTIVWAALAFCVAYFIWSFKLTPWLKYNKFMREMKNGQRRQVECIFKGFSSDTRIYDGVEVYDLSASVGDKDEDERSYVFDADKPLPVLTEGQKVTITSFGNFVVSIAEA